jgi:EmrB/QacA subfamily drug resistance transporter
VSDVADGAAGPGSPAAEADDRAAGAATFLSHRQIMIILPGLLLAMMLAMLDQLVVGTALPRIVGDLGGVTHLSWVVTAYTLASTVTTPFYGKLGDMYGRKKLFIFAITVFLAGSALSGLSQNMAELIIFRAIQGLGAGGLMVGAMATLGEIVPPRERGKYMSYFMVVMMLATIGGPLLGGWITEALTWRWIFYINLPIGGAALVYLIFVMQLPKRRVEHRIDYSGGILLGVMATAIILIATWGGTQYPWGSAPVLGLVALAVVALVAFIMVERRAGEPMMPLHIFKVRNFTLAMAMTFFLGLTLFGVMTFLPLFQQTVQGATPTQSGLLLTPMMVGSMITSVASGWIVTKTGKYKLFPVLGGLIMGGGMFMLSGIGADKLGSGIDYVVIGLGMGLMMQLVSLIAQNSVELRDMGVASSSRMFFQSIGGSLGVAALGALFASRLNGYMAAHGAGGGIHAKGGSFDPAMIARLPGPQRGIVLAAITHAVHSVFILGVPGAVLIFALALFIKEIPLRGRAPDQGKEATQEPELIALAASLTGATGRYAEKEATEAPVRGRPGRTPLRF